MQLYQNPTTFEEQSILYLDQNTMIKEEEFSSNSPFFMRLALRGAFLRNITTWGNGVASRWFVFRRRATSGGALLGAY